MSAVWENTDGCGNQYICALVIYLITILSYSYSIITDCVIHVAGHGNCVFDGTNTKDRYYLKKQMDLISKLASNEKFMVGILPSSSKDVSITLDINLYKLSIIKKG